jgi:2-polyprenyl-3-methyl-5-hydroxy-6-metoxy-1,4-benzoquinol methylase
MNELTDFEFWEKYWTYNNVVIEEGVFFKKLILDFPKEAKLIEIGGFPGKLAAYFKKFKNYNVTILDFYIDQSVIKRVEEANDLPLGSINFIKGDLLKMDLKEQYDIVCSFGFLEHFMDTRTIIERHLKLLNKGGTLFITIPNFTGINGWFQKVFHIENYEKHNIQCMNIKTLKKIVQGLKLESDQVGFFGTPGIWLEKEASASNFILFMITNINRVLKRMPFRENFLLAPYIFIKAKKSKFL